MSEIRPGFRCFLENFSGDLVGVEIGTWSGEYAIVMVEEAKRLGKNLKLYTVDVTPQANVYNMLAPYEGRIELINKFSTDAAKDFPDKHFDWVYIDGGHDYKNCYQDIIAWLPKLKDRGVIAGHDWYFDSVRDAVRDGFSEELKKNLKSHQIEAAGSLSDWWITIGV